MHACGWAACRWVGCVQISEWVSGRVDLHVDGLARRCTDGRGWVGMCVDVLHADGRGMERVGVHADGWVCVRACVRMGGCACRWVGVCVCGWVGVRVCRWVGVRADGWVCVWMGVCVCGWVGCVWISEWVSMRVDLQADGLIQRERLGVDTDGLACRWRGKWVCVHADGRGWVCVRMGHRSWDQ